MKRLLLSLLTVFACVSLSYAQEYTKEDKKLIEQAIEWSDNGNANKAIELYDQLLKKYPNDGTLLYEKAYCYIVKQDFQTAEKLLGKAESNGAAGFAYALHGNCLDNLGKKEEAIKQLGIIYSCYEGWFMNEGLDNITILLEDVLRGSISAETGVAMNRISHLKRDEKTMRYYFVVAGKKYELYADPELFNAANFIFENKEIDDISFNKVISNCKMGLQFGKVALAAGANVRNDSLQAQYTKKYIQSHFGLK